MTTEIEPGGANIVDTEAGHALSDVQQVRSKDTAVRSAHSALIFAIVGVTVLFGAQLLDALIPRFDLNYSLIFPLSYLGLFVVGFLSLVAITLAIRSLLAARRSQPRPPRRATSLACGAIALGTIEIALASYSAFMQYVLSNVRSF